MRGLPDGLTLRPVEDSDGGQLLALVERCFEAYAEDGVVLDPDGLDRDLKRWRSALREDEGEGWVIVDQDGTVRACVGYVNLEDDIFELKRLYLDSDLRGGRIAVGLLALVEKQVMKRGGNLLVAWSDQRFRRAHSFYRREGFATLGETRDLNDPSKTTELRFIKAL